MKQQRELTAPVNPHLREFHCSFEEEPICMFTQDKNDDFDWTRHSADTRDTKYTPNTGPSADRRGSKQGFYMYIETSRPRKERDVARLVSPFFNVAPKNPYGMANPPAYCFGFFFHMYGKHIGTLNAFLRQKGQAAAVSPAWSLSGNQGDRWKQAKVSVHPTTSFQVVLEGIRGPGIEGDIAIDDVTLEEGECRDLPPINRISSAPPSSAHIWSLSVTLAMTFLWGRREMVRGGGIQEVFGSCGPERWPSVAVREVGQGGQTIRPAAGGSGGDLSGGPGVGQTRRGVSLFCAGLQLRNRGHFLP
ncbi:hypothetical protein DPEC_G00089100 [Dallia pectoralis]|uniref:Uncharacterized protein n=1 Tax=Dallia pectoralis TaxID=75939 RepID=A0ACC2H0I3_DALPE|nr:hypothetical protein DPEC_G00089100 [Dallia pectoralis]